MRSQLKSPLAGLVLASLGVTALLTLPSFAEEDGPPRLYFHSDTRSYQDDVAADPASSAGGRAPAGSTLTPSVPTKADSATGTSRDAVGLPGSAIAPTFPMPSSGTLASLCVDIWGSSESAVQLETGTITAHLYIQSQNTVLANAPTAPTFAKFSPLTVTNYKGDAVRMTGLVQPTAPFPLAPETTLSFTVSPASEEPAPDAADFTLHYDSVKHPSSVTINPTKCEAKDPESPDDEEEEEPSEEPTEEPTEEPSIEPTVEPSVTASVCPTGPTTGPTASESEEPEESESPTPSASATSQQPNPVTELVNGVVSSVRPSSSATAAANDAADAPGQQRADQPLVSDCPPVGVGTETAYTGAKSARYGDTVTLSATVTDETGRAVSGGTVSFLIGGATYTAPVGSGGKATMKARIGVAPETYLLESRYNGATGFEKSASEEGFVVSKSPSVCVLQRGVGATYSTLTGVLSRPDGSRIGAAPLTFLYQNRSIGTVRTDSRGVARRENAPKGRAGDLFSVTFAGDTNHTGCRRDLRA